MKRRIFGLEYELGLIARKKNGAKIKVEEAAPTLFREVSSYGLGSNWNFFTTNGCRLYLDIGYHPELSTAECDSLDDLILIDRASERLYYEAAINAAARQKAENGIDLDFYIYKNNVDSYGNGYGCHENYLVDRSTPFQRLVDGLIPFFVTRQVFAGTGKLRQTGFRKWEYLISARSMQIAEQVSGSTTSARPIINTRDEPHADPEKYRRLHIIVGDSNMSCFATKLKVGTTGIVLDLLEGGAIDDNFIDSVSLQNPVQAIKDVARDLSLREPLKRKNGSIITPLEIQSAYIELAMNQEYQELINPELLPIIPLWTDVVDKLGKDPDLTYGMVEWVTKRELINGYAAKKDIKPDDPRYGMIDLQYHDINPNRGLFRRQEYHALSLPQEEPEEKIEVARRLQFGIDHARIDDYKYHPPIRGRPLVRGTLMAIAQIFGLPLKADWQYVKKEGYEPLLLMKDPRNLNAKEIRIFVNGALTEADQGDSRVAKLLDYMYANLN